MKLSKKELRQLIESEIKIISEVGVDPAEIYSESTISMVFKEVADPSFWDDAGDSGSSILREVGLNALEDLGKFIKSNPDWKAWYESMVERGVG